MSRTIRTLPISHLTDAAVATTGTAFAVPTTGIKARLVRIFTTSDAFVGFGADDSPPAAATTNCVLHPGGQQEYYLDDGAGLTHLYVYARDTTTEAFVSFLG